MPGVMKKSSLDQRADARARFIRMAIYSAIFVDEGAAVYIASHQLQKWIVNVVTIKGLHRLEYLSTLIEQTYRASYHSLIAIFFY